MDLNPDGISLDDQEHRLRTRDGNSAPSDNPTNEFWPDDTQKHANVPPGETIQTELDDEPVGAGSALYTHNGIVDRSELPPDILPVTDQPLGDEIEVSGSDTFETDFRDHYDAHYATSDYEYVQYQPAYRYGYELGMDERYHDRDWRATENDARREWESAHPTNLWEQFKDAIRFGWDAARSRQR
jgi:hypothetical protein